jgi:hypothetical protein
MEDVSVHEFAGKGESRWAHDQRLYGRDVGIVNGRGYDAIMHRAGVDLLHELKFIGKNKRVRTGDAGALAAADLLTTASAACDEVVAVVNDGFLHFATEDLEEFTAARMNFKKRRVSQRNWVTLRRALSACSLIAANGHRKSSHPWVLQPGLMDADMQLSPFEAFADADVVVLARDFAYLLVPRACFEHAFQFRGEVAPPAIPNFTVNFPNKKKFDSEKLLTDNDEIFRYTERLYEYVVRYKSSNSDPDTGRKRKI